MYAVCCSRINYNCGSETERSMQLISLLGTIVEVEGCPKGESTYPRLP
jgi:hypothetical protein